MSESIPFTPPDWKNFREVLPVKPNLVEIRTARMSDLYPMLQARIDAISATCCSPELEISPDHLRKKLLAEEPKTKAKYREILDDPESHLVLLATQKGIAEGFCIAQKDRDSYYDETDHNTLVTPPNRIREIYVKAGVIGEGLGKRFVQLMLEWMGTEKNITTRILYHPALDRTCKILSVYVACGFTFKGEGEKLENSYAKIPYKVPPDKSIPMLELIRYSNSSPVMKRTTGDLHHDIQDTVGRFNRIKSRIIP